MNWPGLVILGLTAGIVSGTLGVGSGLVLVPALVLLFDQPQKSAQGISLLVMAPMAAMGAWRYILNPDIRVNVTMAAIIVIGALAGAMVGAHLAGVLPAATLRKLFAIFLLVVGVRILLSRPGNAAVQDDGAVPVIQSESQQEAAMADAADSGQ